MRTGYRIFLSAVFIAVMSSASWGANISGTITNSSSFDLATAVAPAGRIYLIVQNQWGDTGFGTSIAPTDPGYPTYTIKGLPPSGNNGPYHVYGFIDTRGNGLPYAGSPIGSQPGDPGFTVAGSDVAGINVTFTDQAPQQGDPPYPAQPGGVNATAGNNSAMVFWDTPKNMNQIEIADHYNVYWGTNSDVGPGVGKTVGGGSVTVTSIGDGGHRFISPLAVGTWYFGVEAVFNGTTSAITRSSQVTIGGAAPVGSKTIGGTIFIKDKNGSPVSTDKPMLVALTQGKMPLYFTYLSAGASVSSRTFSIPGVSPGQYQLFAMVDQNNDNRKDAGDWSTPEADVLNRWIDVQADLPGLSIDVLKQNVMELLTTGYNSYNGYTLQFRFDAAEKRPAKVDITGGPNMPQASMTINMNRGFELQYSVALPKVGDAYTGTVTFTDGTTEPFTLPVTGVLSSMPSINFPNGATGPDSTTPTFSWRLLNPPAGDYRYHVTLNSQNGGDWLMEKWLGANTLSAPFAGTPLGIGGMYSWNVELVDSFGNSAGNGMGFTPQATGPTITSVSPQTLACGSTSTITITGTGFDPVMANNLVYFNNAGQATVTSASATQLGVQLPTCNGNNTSTGPVTVVVNGVAASSATDFTPTISYSYGVNDSSNVALPGATVQVNEIPALTASTNGSGLFTLNGIPSGLPFSLNITAPSFVPVYSHTQVQAGNWSKTGGYAMYTQSQLDGWNGGATGKGAIKSRTIDNASGPNLGGVAVTAYSTLHKSSSYYAVAYNDASNNFCSPPTCTTTASTGNGTGVYYVLNVEEGDTVLVTGTKANYSFPTRTFKTHAGAVSEGQLPGTPIPTITSLSVTSGVIGSTMTINGTNFNTNPGANSVRFSGNNAFATVNSASATQLNVTVPQFAQNGPITVTVNGISATSASSFSLLGPTITGFTPTQGPSGTNITITGTNFSLPPYQYDNQVNINGNGAGIISASATQLVVSAPATTGTGNIYVQTSGGSTVSATGFTVLPWPNYGTLPPNTTATIGSPVTITGANYYDLDPTKYQVLVGNNIPATVTSVTNNSLVFTAPNGATTGGGVVVYYFNGSSFVGNLNIQYPLAVSISAGGTVNKTSPNGSLTCSSSSCSGNFDYNTFVSLHATPSSGYQFQGWSGDCGGPADCGLNMDNSKAVTATFNPLLYIKNGTNYYSSLQTAFDTAVNLDNVLAQAQLFTINNLVFNRNGVQVKLKGGYDGSFVTNGGFSTVSGKLSIMNGTLQVENLKIM